MPRIAGCVKEPNFEIWTPGATSARSWMLVTPADFSVSLLTVTSDAGTFSKRSVRRVAVTIISLEPRAGDPATGTAPGALLAAGSACVPTICDSGATDERGAGVFSAACAAPATRNETEAAVA